MMAKQKISFLLLAAALIFLFLLPQVILAEPADNLSGAGINANVVILSPGHSRTIFYELHDIIYNDVSAVHTTFIFTLGAGTLTVSVASTTPMGKGSEILYATTGFIGLTPVLDYAYGSSPISMSLPLSDSPVNIGFLLTSVVAGIGSPDFPVTMSMTFYLAPAP